MRQRVWVTVHGFAGPGFVSAPQFAANEPTRWFGLVERAGTSALLHRVAVLALSLRRARVAVDSGRRRSRGKLVRPPRADVPCGRRG